MIEIANAVSQWPDVDRRRFYCFIAHGLTIAGRGVWNNSQLDDAQRVEQLKWLNELQHRVLGRVISHDEWGGTDAFGRYLDAFAEEHAELAAVIAHGVQRAFEQAAARPAE